MRPLLLVALLMWCSPGSAQDDKEGGKKEDVPGLHFEFKDRPTFRYGNSLEIEIISKWHLDGRQFYPSVINPPVTDHVFNVTRARFGVKGEVTKLVNYEVEREFRGTLQSDHPYHPWKDVNVEFRPFDFLRFKVGKFKLPFGLEQNTSSANLDFVYRSRTSDLLTPARERGAMLHGKFLNEGRFNYEAAVFRYDGENSDNRGVPTAGRTYAARVSGEPLRYVRFLPTTIRHTYLGVATTTGRMFEGQSSLHGQTVSDLTFFERVFVKGYRRRTGAEMEWTEGQFSLKGEYVHMSEQRKAQGIHEEDLPDKISRGWYVTGAWVAVGKMKSKGATPRDPFVPGRSFGALEVAARLDVVTFYSDSATGLPSPSPRAANLKVNSARTWTFGATWYLNRFAKLQANGEREWIADPARRDFDKQSIANRNLFWTAVVRLQLAM